MDRKKFKHQQSVFILFLYGFLMLLSGCAGLHASSRSYRSVIMPLQRGKVSGVVVLDDPNGTLQVSYNLSNLLPLSEHDFAIYTADSCALLNDIKQTDFSKSTMDLGNIQADAKGNAVGFVIRRGFSLQNLSVIHGYMVVLYQAARDPDFPKRNLGAVMACGLIKNQSFKI